MTLDEDDVKAVVKALTESQSGISSCGSFNPEEREWLHTAAKYVPSTLLPLLGRILQMFNETAYSVGMMFMKFFFFASGAGIVIWVLHKFGVLK